MSVSRPLHQGVWEDTYRILPGLVMTDDQIKHAVNSTLRTMFKGEADDNEAKHEAAGLTNRKRRKNHGRFNTWLFLRFGRKDEVRNILRYGCSEKITPRLQDISES